jgi:sugar fermentation stimulation protein A
MPEPLYKFNRPFIAATVIARPSRHNKSPYLLDCRLDNGEEAIVHNPALKCNGLVEPGARVYLQPAASAKSLSKYVLYLVSAPENVLVCIHPTIANDICEALICRGTIAPFIEQVRREVVCGDCRFDFYGLVAGRDTYIEVKSASMADRVNVMPGQRTAALAALSAEAPLMAIFPYGNRPKLGLVSERALKHVEGLRSAVEAGCQAHLVYISMRPDVTALKVSELDTVYRRAVMDARAAGVRVVAVSVRWDIEGACWFERTLDVI